MRTFERTFVAVCAALAINSLTPDITVAAKIDSANSDSNKFVEQTAIPYEMFTLDNGLTVIVHTDHTVPTVFVGMWYLVGSKDEPPGKTGFAHLFEHLMFQGTENRDGEYFEPLIKAGATGTNGTTNPDRTNYFATVPTAALDLALWLESDRMIHLLGAIDQAALDEQRSVVKNEKRQGENRPYGLVNKTIQEGLFPVGHPYHHTTIGSMEDLENAALEDVHAWFRKYYGASNAFLVLSGDVDVETAREKVEKYFAAAPVGEPLIKSAAWTPELDSKKVDVIYDKAPRKLLQWSWTLPPASTKDSVIMGYVYETLGNNENSLLKRRLIDELNLASSVGVTGNRGLLSGQISLYANLNEGVTHEEASAAIADVIAEYLELGPDEGMLEAKKLSDRKGNVMRLEGNTGKGFTLANDMLWTGDPGFHKQSMIWEHAATADDVRAVAQKWLSRPHHELRLYPFAAKEQAHEDADRSRLPEVTTVKTDVQFPPLETAMLPNGAKLIVAERKNLPRVVVSFDFNTGANADLDSAMGAGSTVFSLLDKGTNRYPKAELHKKMDAIAMSPGFQSQADISRMYFSVLKENLKDSFTLALEVLTNPAFSEEELLKEKEKLKINVDFAEKEPTANSMTFFRRILFGREKPGARVMTPEDVSQLSREDIVEFYNREVTPNNMTIIMIGDIDMPEAKGIMKRTFEKWRATGDSQLRSNGAALPKARRLILIDKPGSQQTQIIAGHALPKYSADDEARMEMMNAVFGGSFDARINMNLREDKGWTYGISSFVLKDPTADQAFVISGNVQTDKTAESLAEIMKEVKAYRTSSPATREEYERVVLSQTRSMAGRFSGTFSFLNSILRSVQFGLSPDHEAGEADRIRQVSLDALQNTVQEMIDPNALSWIVVGDLEKIEESVRALDYGAVEVWDPYGNRVR